MMAFANRDVFFDVNEARDLDARTVFTTPTSQSRRRWPSLDPGWVRLRHCIQRLEEAAVRRSEDLPAPHPGRSAGEGLLGGHALQLTHPLGAPDRAQSPTLGSQSDGLTKNDDGSYDASFGPEAPKGKESNWLQTVPGKGCFTILRMYGPLEPWLHKKWRPGEIEPNG